MILVTGGTGFIGSHTAVELLQNDKKIIILDNLVNSNANIIDKIKQITKIKPLFINGDINDESLLNTIFEEYEITMVIHFAALKAVGESVCEPLKYYDNNVAGTLTLLKAMATANVKKLVFSSSATVYGKPLEIPITEKCPIGVPTNPYGHSKIMVEHILQDLIASDETWSIAVLRYFNPIGAHESGLIGELPNGVPSNLLPYITQVASGKIKELSVYGDDYNTHDGTGIRDYIHVVDLAIGHLKAYDYISNKQGLYTWNLGTGNGYSVLQIIQAFEDATKVKIAYKIMPRRPGDIDKCWANCNKAATQLNWQATRDINQMMVDSWRWQCNI